MTVLIIFLSVPFETRGGIIRKLCVGDLVELEMEKKWEQARGEVLGIIGVDRVPVTA